MELKNLSGTKLDLWIKALGHVFVRVGPDPWEELQVDPARAPQAARRTVTQGLGQPGALPKGLVKKLLYQSKIFH